jgi:hypothetical protein
MKTYDDFEARLTKAMAITPDMPDCYGEIMGRIKRKNAVSRAAWALAAVLVLSLTSLLYVDNRHRQAIPPEVVEELQSIQSHVAGDDIREELVSCSLVGIDLE